MSAPRPEVLWCSNRSGNRVHARFNGWSFPPKIERHLREMTAGKRVFHPFGGLARFGPRGDIDREVHPDVIADAWLPPFQRDAFDVVVLDPPYTGINQQMKAQLLYASAFIARETVIWFHTMWIASGSGLSLRRSWLVRIGDSCSVRCLQEFVVKPGPKPNPLRFFTRGPAMRYNRWLTGQLPLLR